MCYVSIGSGPFAAHSIYVTNKTKAVELLFVRVNGKKLSVDTELHSKLSLQMVDSEVEEDLSEQQKRRLVATMHKAEFYVVKPEIPKPFHVENRDSPMYICVHDGFNLLENDVVVYPSEYGCITIRGDSSQIHIQPSNPEPVWIPCRQGDTPPRYAMKAKKVDSSEDMYFGRSQGSICFVDIKDGFCDSWISMFDGEYRKQSSGELLKDTGYGIMKAKRGDLLPPNTLQVDGVYVGRNHGDYLCPIHVRNGMVRDFLSIFKIKSKKGEIVVMTEDPRCS